MTFAKSLLTSRRLYSRLFLLTFLAAISLLPYWSKAETKPRYPSHIDYLPSGNFEIKFAPGSSSVPDEAMVDWMPCIRAINLDSIIVIVYYEIAGSQDNDAHVNLAATRASSIRTFFEEMGVPTHKIYTETRKPQLSDSSSIPSGVATVEYFGRCAGAFADCYKTCSKQ